MTLSEIKSYVVVLSFYIKMMKRRTLQACSLKHIIKKACFLFRTNWIYLSRAGGSTPQEKAMKFFNFKDILNT